jgi:hypothetical protein
MVYLSNYSTYLQDICATAPQSSDHPRPNEADGGGALGRSAPRPALVHRRPGEGHAQLTYQMLGTLRRSPAISAVAGPSLAREPSRYRGPDPAQVRAAPFHPSRPMHRVHGLRHASSKFELRQAPATPSGSRPSRT